MVLAVSRSPSVVPALLVLPELPEQEVVSLLWAVRLLVRSPWRVLAWVRA